MLEGLDGSGKSTQIKILEKKLKEEGFSVEKIDFPQYGKKSAGLIEEYLAGHYGTEKEVSPYIASIFYASDRYDANKKINKWLEEGKVVISDRYTPSSAGHQGGKIKNKKERDKFFKWLFDLEYGIFKLSKPDIIIFLKTSPKYSIKLVSNLKNKEKIEKKKLYLGNEKKDIHEKSISHLTSALNSYLQFGKNFKKDFKIINCIKNNKLLSVGEVNKMILKEVNNFIIQSK